MKEQKPLLVLLHGWASSGQIWHEALSELCKDFEVFTPELTGHGDSDCTATTLHQLALELQSQVARPAVWLGWSLGALVAIQAALSCPQYVRSLLLVSPTPAFQQQQDWQQGVPVVDMKEFMWSFEQRPRDTLRRFYGLQVMDDRHARSVLQKLSAAEMTAQFDDIYWGLEVLRNTDLRVSLKQLNMPLSVLHGEEDRVIPVAASQWIEANTKAKLTTWSDTGHAPFLSRPDAFVTWVKGELS